MNNFGKYIAITALLGAGASGTITTVSAGETGAKYVSNGAVKFIPNTDPTNPIDPTDPTNPDPVDPIDPTNPDGPNPGTPGPLSIDFASSLDFGVNKISSKNEIYYASPQTYKEEGKTTPNYVQVTDNRGSSTGWTLKVLQDNQFSNATAKYNELKGAQITINDSQAVSNAIGVTAPTVAAEIELTPGSPVTVMTAAEGAGDGTWLNRFGTNEMKTEVQADGTSKEVEKNTSVQLAVPGSTPKSAVEYRSTLTWLLSDVVSN
ncbi:WxL domain-containing protein [Brochothrix campestris]|uniref:Cell surface protein with WxL domain n=1 Tax=Brochothrix campestris FSL F6-1037 TaxID=1265861 RepID=W7CJI9_9LIST|nr:WxL domain-containing protein [Brochothrix campestris]EUJ39544.1 cell surface protein with WxL domain [Brochothrix campestris FSL F6-1037]